MNVYQAISAVQKDLAHSGIAKTRENTFDKYKFRGIDEVYNALSPLLAKHGLCILPRMVSREVVERESQKGGALFYVTVEAEFDFVSAEDGSKHTVRTFGEAMDRGDKATNKAMSAAYKYAAFQTFAIPTEGDNDADANTHEVKPVGIGHTGQQQGESYLAAMDEEQQAYIRQTASRVTKGCQDGFVNLAYDYIAAQGFGAEEKIALNSLLDSKVRAALKEEGQRRRVGASVKEAA